MSKYCREHKTSHYLGCRECRIKDLEQQLEDLRKDDQISECACCGYAGDNLPAYRNLLKQAHNDNREKRIANLEAENEHLENLLAEGIHTCSKTCKRPMCVLRREKAELEQQLATLREAARPFSKCVYLDEITPEERAVLSNALLEVVNGR